eukprot:TRINITY_DN5088_c0_g1_i1.p1 TRINITY_DN5088_c0_g1~~TRINITY_DN5088_c0_g1_i1.p1  ORF type:complete len:679 (+),score=201.06 TRINITY_DN5088_c0_g1_i1:68-2104(+)
MLSSVRCVRAGAGLMRRPSTAWPPRRPCPGLRPFPVLTWEQGRWASQKPPQQTPPKPAEAVDTKPKPKPKPKLPVMLWKLAQEIWPKATDPGAGWLRTQVVVAVGCVFATKLFGVGVPYWFKGIVDSLSLDAAVQAAAFNPLGVSLLGLVLGHSLFKTMQALTQEARGALFAPVVQAAVRNLGLRVAKHLHALPLQWHLNRQTGALSRSIDRGTRAVDRLLNFALFHIVPTVLELTLVSAVLYHEAGFAFTATAIGAVVGYTGFTFTLSSWRIKVRQQMNKADGAASSAIIEGLQNYETVKYFQNEKYELSRYDRLLRAYEKPAVTTSQSLGALNFGQQFIFTAALGVTMAMSVTRVASGTMTLGDLILVNTLLMQLSVPLNFLGTVYRELQTALTDFEALFALLAVDGKNDTTHFPAFVYKTGAIEFNDVHFRYKPSQPMLQGISFTVPGGTSLGVVGPSGCGKSTILRLLFGFYSADSGRITVDGQDVTQVSVDTLRSAYGVIPQDVVLFNESILNNIRYGNLDATDEACIEASKAAGLHSAVSSFTDGYETRVGARGVKLSGGEKQRVAIARCLLRAAPILLADEATSALDTRTESLATSALRSCGGEDRPLTSILIAHRLSTVMHCDNIMVLRAGGIEEFGSHEELLDKGGLYADMWQQQQQDALESAGSAASA